MNCSHQVPLSMGFPRQEYWSGFPFPSPGESSSPKDFFFFNFSFFSFYFYWRLFTLQYCSGFLPYIDMNQPWVFMCCPSWTPSPLPPHPIPQGHPSALALSTLPHVLNLDWRSVSHDIIHVQYYSLKSSHPCLLPQSPKDCSLYLCLFCCLTLGSLLPSF